MRVLVAAALGLLLGCEARPDGAPYCTLEPGHGSLSRPTTAGAAQWSFTNFRGDPVHCYTPDIPLLIKLQGTEFHGFVVKGPTESQFDDLPGPVFRHYRWAQFSNCATHREPDLRRKLVMMWTAKRSLGTINFRAVTFLADNKEAPSRAGVYTETRASLAECSHWERHPEPHSFDSCPAFVEKLKFSHVYECETHGMCPLHMRCCHGLGGGQICYPPQGRRLHHGGKCGHFQDTGGDCQIRVPRDPNACTRLDTFEATQCRYTCCQEWLITTTPHPTAPPLTTPTPRPLNPDPTCAAAYSNRKSIQDCGRWLRSDVGKKNCRFPDSFEARNCQQLCCELGTRVPATPPPFVPRIITDPVTTTTEAPCKDDWHDCRRFLDKCDSDTFMRADCRWTCGLCAGGRPRPQSLVRKLSQTLCADKDPGCSQWRTDCGRGGYVDENCRQTCGLCRVPGEDQQREISDRSRGGAGAFAGPAATPGPKPAPRNMTRRPRPTTRAWQRTRATTRRPRPAIWRPRPTTRRPRPTTRRPRPATRRPRPKPTTRRPRPKPTTRRPRPATRRPRPTTRRPRPKPTTRRPRPTTRRPRTRVWKPRVTTRRPRPRPKPTTRRPRPVTTPKPKRITSTTCIDEDSGCWQWGEFCADDEYTRLKCRATCKLCTSGSRTRQHCSDSTASCAFFAARCGTGDLWVERNCRATCGHCPTASSGWAASAPSAHRHSHQSQPASAPSHHSHHSQPAIAASTDCRDTDARCPTWRRLCVQDAWIERECRRTCGGCGGGGHSLGRSWVETARWTAAPAHARPSPRRWEPATHWPQASGSTHCEDRDQNCRYWGHFCSDYSHIRKSCPRSCGQC